MISIKREAVDDVINWHKLLDANDTQQPVATASASQTPSALLVDEVIDMLSEMLTYADENCGNVSASKAAGGKDRQVAEAPPPPDVPSGVEVDAGLFGQSSLVINLMSSMPEDGTVAHSPAVDMVSAARRASLVLESAISSHPGQSPLIGRYISEACWSNNECLSILRAWEADGIINGAFWSRLGNTLDPSVKGRERFAVICLMAILTYYQHSAEFLPEVAAVIHAPCIHLNDHDDRRCCLSQQKGSEAATVAHRPVTSGYSRCNTLLTLANRDANACTYEYLMCIIDFVTAFQLQTEQELGNLMDKARGTPSPGATIVTDFRLETVRIKNCRGEHVYLLDCLPSEFGAYAARHYKNRYTTFQATPGQNFYDNLSSYDPTTLNTLLEDMKRYCQMAAPVFDRLTTFVANHEADPRDHRQQQQQQQQVDNRRRRKSPIYTEVYSIEEEAEEDDAMEEDDGQSNLGKLSRKRSFDSITRTSHDPFEYPITHDESSIEMIEKFYSSGSSTATATSHSSAGKGVFSHLGTANGSFGAQSSSLESLGKRPKHRESEPQLDSACSPACPFPEKGQRHAAKCVALSRSVPYDDDIQQQRINDVNLLADIVDGVESHSTGYVPANPPATQDAGILALPGDPSDGTPGTWLTIGNQDIQSNELLLPNNPLLEYAADQWAAEVKAKKPTQKKASGSGTKRRSPSEPLLGAEEARQKKPTAKAAKPTADKVTVLCSICNVPYKTASKHGKCSFCPATCKLTTIEKKFFRGYNHDHTEPFVNFMANLGLDVTKDHTLHAFVYGTKRVKNRALENCYTCRQGPKCCLPCFTQRQLPFDNIFIGLMRASKQLNSNLHIRIAYICSLQCMKDVKKAHDTFHLEGYGIPEAIAIRNRRCMEQLG
jgi:hypothetical protein